MSPEMLRDAAALMRKRTEHSPDSPWRARLFDGADQVVDTDGDVIADCPEYDLVNQHIASWHPAVALAVADWLEHMAERWAGNFKATQSPSAGVDCPPGVHFGDPVAAARDADYHARHALAVAAAYLGRPA